MSTKAAVSPTYLLANLPSLIIGGAVFNTQYAADPSKLPIKEILDHAFTKGLNAVDTSPYYGKSEELLGAAFQQIDWPRESYFLCTKAGRVQLDEFDYSRLLVRKLVLRSLQRLHTSYLDLVYMHDIEFVEESQIYEALRELRLLKDEGLIRNFGVSGYPLEVLYKVASTCKDNDIGPLDAILSYSNGCIQNTKLFEMYDDFVACGLKKILNGSILSMSLLRSGVTHAFHPARQELKDKVAEVADKLKSQNVELADVATRFALKRWLFDTAPESKEWNKKTGVVLGVSSVEELNAAIEAYEAVQKPNDDEVIYEDVKRQLGPFFNETWPSGFYK